MNKAIIASILIAFLAAEVCLATEIKITAETIPRSTTIKVSIEDSQTVFDLGAKVCDMATGHHSEFVEVGSEVDGWFNVKHTLKYAGFKGDEEIVVLC